MDHDAVRGEVSAADAHQLEPRTAALSEDARDVLFDGALRNMKQLGDLLIGRAGEKSNGHPGFGARELKQATAHLRNQFMTERREQRDGIRGQAVVARSHWVSDSEL
jgi:hypothetical protein